MLQEQADARKFPYLIGRHFCELVPQPPVSDWEVACLYPASAPPEPSGSSIAYLVRAFSPCISSARSISLSISSRNAMPEASHKLGYMLMEVKPRMVVTSFRQSLPPFFSMK